jgi:hypothetical protein
MLFDTIQDGRDGAARENENVFHLMAQEGVQHQVGAFDRLGGGSDFRLG